MSDPNKPGPQPGSESESTMIRPAGGDAAQAPQGGTRADRVRDWVRRNSASRAEPPTETRPAVPRSGGTPQPGGAPAPQGQSQGQGQRYNPVPQPGAPMTDVRSEPSRRLPGAPMPAEQPQRAHAAPQAQPVMPRQAQDASAASASSAPAPTARGQQHFLAGETAVQPAVKGDAPGADPAAGGTAESLDDKDKGKNRAGGFANKLRDRAKTVTAGMAGAMGGAAGATAAGSGSAAAAPAGGGGGVATVTEADPEDTTQLRRAGVARRTRKARLRLSQVDPWSVMKTAFLFAVAAGIVLWVATGTVWAVISSSGMFEEINKMVGDIIQTPGDDTPFRIQDYISTSKVMGTAALIAVIDVVIFTALATMGAFLYNLASAMIGGLEVTLAED
ncbi:DUF3566 domain-containing protein [Ammonicoccus fulvus]|uniref:DUF3566 domain-containing protein n=1 Tax=Ammonicoccus fulvus TaxID=3138240 RepID=A0ABZ3FUX4_9ACTN